MRKLGLFLLVVFSASLFGACVSERELLERERKAKEEREEARTPYEWVQLAMASSDGLGDVPQQYETKEMIGMYTASIILKPNSELGGIMSYVNDSPGFDVEIANRMFRTRPEIAQYLGGEYLTAPMAKWLGENGFALQVLFSRASLGTPEIIEQAYREDPVGTINNLGNDAAPSLLKRYLREHSDGFDRLYGVRSWSSWDLELVQLVWRAGGYRSYSLIPEEFRDYNMSREAVKKDGSLLEYVPREQKFRNNGELCAIALRQTNAAEDYVPFYFKYDFRPR